jgi:CheY-like chemotaxis protein/HPt (histidine-containing phosphotransfer) domain-containing protein
MIGAAQPAVATTALESRAFDGVAIPAIRIASARRLQVLVAEDNAINRTVVQALLTNMGLHTVVAHNGREAVAMAAGRDHDAIFMDCLMPELDGFQATRQIRAGEDGRHVPIIAITALSMPGDRERCLAAGMDDYLSKPIRRSELDAAIGRWLPAGERHVQAPGAGNDGGNGASDTADADSSSQPEDGVLDPGTVLQLRRALTPEIRGHLIDTFEKQQDQCIADIDKAVQRGDRDQVRQAAHLLKGSSASLGASGLRLRCQQLEHMGRRQDPSVSKAQIALLRVSAAEASHALRQQLTD